jgi:hypothetical protein
VGFELVACRRDGLSSPALGLLEDFVGGLLLFERLDSIDGRRQGAGGGDGAVLAGEQVPFEVVTSAAPRADQADERSGGVDVGGDRSQAAFDVTEVVASVGGGLAGFGEFSAAIGWPLVEDGLVGGDDVP